MHNNTNIDTGSITFTCTDNDGDQFSWMKLNPTDPRIMNKCKNMADAFMSSGDKFASHIQWEEFVEDKFCEFLGYDCKKSLFGRIAATDIMADGRCFASHVIDILVEHIGPEIRKRRAQILARHTAKYQK
jgi:hypothetical protein